MASPFSDLTNIPTDPHTAALREALVGTRLPYNRDGTVAVYAPPGTNNDDAPDLGDALARFRNLFLTGGIDIDGTLLNIRDLRNLSPIILTRDSTGVNIDRAGEVPDAGLHTYTYRWGFDDLPRAEVIVASPQTAGESLINTVLYTTANRPSPFVTNSAPYGGGTKEEATAFLPAGRHGLYYTRRAYIGGLTRDTEFRFTFAKGYPVSTAASEREVNASRYGVTQGVITQNLWASADLSPEDYLRPPVALASELNAYTLVTVGGIGLVAANGARASIGDHGNLHGYRRESSAVTSSHSHSASFTPSRQTGSDNQQTTIPASVSIAASTLPLNDIPEINAVRAPVQIGDVVYGRGAKPGGVFSEFAGETLAEAQTAAADPANLATRGHDGFIILKPSQ